MINGLSLDAGEKESSMSVVCNLQQRFQGSQDLTQVALDDAFLLQQGWTLGNLRHLNLALGNLNLGHQPALETLGSFET